MDYYGTQFRCWLYRQNGATHGMETVSDALRDSCNIFSTMWASTSALRRADRYAKAYGLGESTGIELAESTGVNAGPEYSASVGATWYAGNTLSAAIGQSDNPFTPLQIANYVATLVNRRHPRRPPAPAGDGCRFGNVTEYEPKVLNTWSLRARIWTCHQAGYAGGGAEYEIRGSGLQKSDRRAGIVAGDRLCPGHRSGERQRPVRLLLPL